MNSGHSLSVPATLAGLSAVEFAEVLPDPVIFFDRSGGLLYANRAALETFGGLVAGTIVLLRFRTPEMRTLIEGLLQGAHPAAVEHVERVPLERVFRVSGSTLGADGAVKALVFRDMSETRRIDRMRADFIANASHELRTPLASVSGFIETLRGPARNDPKAQEKFLGIMQNQTGRMARLIDDLLSLSRLEMKSKVDASSVVDMKLVLRDVLASLAPLAQENGVAIETVFPPEEFRVSGDRDELFQVFENLVENACKYGQGGGRIVVSLAAGVDGPQPEVDVTVTDFGPGIAEEHIPRITERFYRVDAGASRAQKGTGLGLAIVKHILTRHDGRLTVRSELAKGSSFTTHLPRA